MAIRRLLLTLLLWGLCSSAHAGGLYLQYKASVSVPSAYADILFWLNFDNGAPTTPYTANPYLLSTSGGYPEYTAGDSSGAYSTTPSASDPGAYVKVGAARFGSYGLHIQNDTAGMSMNFSVGDGLGNEQIATHSQGALGFWWQPNASCGFQNLFTIGDNTAGKLTIGCSGGNIGVCMYDPSGPTTVCTSDVTIGAIPQWYFVMVRWNDAANTLNINVWDGSSTTTQSSASAWTAPANWDGTFLDMGFFSNYPSGDIYLDNIMTSNLSTRNFITDNGPDGVTKLMNYTGSPR